MERQQRNNKSLHHIIGKCNHDKFNVDFPENKEIITQKTHDAINNLFKQHQSPKEQWIDMVELWSKSLSERTRQDLLEIFNRQDRSFYLRKLVK